MNELINILTDLFCLGLEKFGLYYSQYRGFVQSNDDPKNLSRLQINVPELHGDSSPSIWAWPGNNFSGNGYGMQCIPQNNDLVWVKFEKGNPRKPIWFYGYFAIGEKPTNLTDKKNFWFKTPGGHLIELDDTNQSIKITHPSIGAAITIKDSIKLEGLGSKIEITNSGVNIDAGLKSITVGGDKQVLYANVPGSIAIASFGQIGVSQKVSVGS